jgi:hypothetical protein
MQRKTLALTLMLGSLTMPALAKNVIHIHVDAHSAMHCTVVDHSGPHALPNILSYNEVSTYDANWLINDDWWHTSAPKKPALLTIAPTTISFDIQQYNVSATLACVQNQSTLGYSTIHVTGDHKNHRYHPTLDSTGNLHATMITHSTEPLNIDWFVSRKHAQ